MKHLCILLVVLVGCVACQGGDGDDGVDHKAVEAAQAPLISAARRANGDWSKLSDADKKLFLDRARGNEQAARQMAGMMGSGAPPSGSGPKR